VKQAALDQGLRVLQPEKASDPAFVDEMRRLRPDLIVVVAYGQILKPTVLDLPPLGCINVHASLLPELRGAAPIQWAVIRGYPETGVTTMRMDGGMDTGPILLQEREWIRPDDTAASLGGRLATIGAALLIDTVAQVEAGCISRLAQDNSRATYAPLLRKEDGAVAWEEPAPQVRNRIHGCNPSPGAYTQREGQLLKLWRAAVEPHASGPAAPPGTVMAASGELAVAAGEGVVRLLEVQPESRARMSGAEFVRGYHVLSGERWTALPGRRAAG
jgi:methionyl-tRNA formyltransferase